MPQRKKVLEDIEALNSLKDLAESYEEIAVVRMQNIKDSVLKTRDFLQELSDVYVDLKTSYAREVKELLKKQKAGDKSLAEYLRKNGKTLLVYLSSNGKLYGSVTNKTYKLFVQDIKKYPNADLLLIGNAGREIYEASEHHRPFEYFDIPDSDIGIEHIKRLVAMFVAYDKVFIYYGKFGNVIMQSAISSSITGEDIFETEVPETVAREDRFVFEPALEKIFAFFETQIKTNLLSQTLLENQLARHASRVNAMEEALGNIELEAKRLEQQRVKMKHQMQNKKQLETIGGLALWVD
jgi:ATP synthase F1 gamma subunit